MKDIKHLTKEIRMNEQYAHVYYSDYDLKPLKEESTPVIKSKTILTNDYIKRIYEGCIEGNMIPPNCRYIEKLNRGTLVMIEEPPAIRTITLNMSLYHELQILKL